MTIVYQGEPYLDPNPPEEDEATKKKREKAGIEPEIPMITPEPIIMANENGREFEIQLGRFEQIKQRDESMMQMHSREGEETPAQPEASVDQNSAFETQWI
jgi:hypothetical protein